MKPIIISSGEPAGIGPDLVIQAILQNEMNAVVIGNRDMLDERARQLGITINFVPYQQGVEPCHSRSTMTVINCELAEQVIPGQLNPKNSSYVLTLLETATKGCLQGEFSALVTAPVHKGIINQAGIPFSGHTEFLAKLCNSNHVVMMLVCKAMRVALITTHIPLNQVSNAITKKTIHAVVETVNNELITKFGMKKPKLLMTGLNPHAGENGFLGKEEIDTIIPCVKQLQRKGIDVEGPFPADTLFSKENCQQADCFIAMYHDQGLSVLKYAGFGEAVNVTLGLPIIRTSVDHGTALTLAATGKANHQSLMQAIKLAKTLALKYRKTQCS